MTGREAMDWVTAHVTINPGEYVDWGKVHRALNELAARELPRVCAYYATKDILPTADDADADDAVLASDDGLCWVFAEYSECVVVYKFWAPVPKTLYVSDTPKISSIKTKEQIQAELKYTKVFNSMDFRVLVSDGLITPHDGSGYYHDGHNETTIGVFQHKNGLDVYPFVCWYNK